MARERLTPERIRRFTHEGDGSNQTFMWDSEVPRLAVRATRNGAKSFIFETKMDRRTIRRTIGSVSNWTVEAARNEARRLQTLVDQGIDPRTQDQERKDQVQQQLALAVLEQTSLGTAWTAYLLYLSNSISPKTKRPRSERYIQDHHEVASPGGLIKKRGGGKTVQGPLFSLLAVPLKDLDDKKIASWLQEQAAIRPSSTAHAYRLLRAFFAWAKEDDSYKAITQTDACLSLKVKSQLPTSTTRDDCLQKEQLQSWFCAVNDIANPVIATYLKILLLTGARREELAALKWENIDQRWNTLTIKDKVEGERTIPLTPYVKLLITELPRNNEWVFSSQASESGRIVNATKSHAKTIKENGLPHISLHGLRRSFATLSEWVECPAGIAAQIMGHKPSAIAEKHYHRRPIDLLRVWHEKIEKWILEHAFPKETDSN